MSFICGGVHEETLTKDLLQPGLNKSVDINSKDAVMLLLFPLKCVKVQSMYSCSILQSVCSCSLRWSFTGLCIKSCQ